MTIYVDDQIGAGPWLSALGEPVMPAHAADPADGLVVRFEEGVERFRADLGRHVRRGLQVACESGALLILWLDPQGEEVPGLRIARRGVEDYQAARARWYPLVIDPTRYEPAAHRAEAEQYRDRIGDRLLRPDQVEPDKRHLIRDDHQRAERVRQLPYRGRVLDVGTSDGTLLLEAVRKYAIVEAVGADVASSAIAEACAAIATDAAFAGRVRFVEAFIEDLDFPDASFDVVSACETLEHVGPGQFDRAFENLLRMLKPGGDFFVTVPNRYPRPHYESEGRARWAWPAHHQFFTECSLRHLLSPHFDALRFVPLYDGEAPGESIYLICHAVGRRT